MFKLEEWHWSQNSRTIDPFRLATPGPFCGSLDLYHWEHLTKNIELKNSPELWKAWVDWIALGQFEHGEYLREEAWLMAKELAQRRILFQEVSSGLLGTRSEQIQFRNRWHATAVWRAMKVGNNWQGLTEFKVLYRILPDVSWEKSLELGEKPYPIRMEPLEHYSDYPIDIRALIYAVENLDFPWRFRNSQVREDRNSQVREDRNSQVRADMTSYVRE